ncbi:aspartyl protease family protein [Cellvibrio sp. UBA7661]|uniref:aspartyl protease family protein n=1 Tax=Cellvibrio sp. UBA7661 TaxID=1946311 RepID=UPI002F355BE9
MKRFPVFVISIIAFSLGFYASEYRHQQRAHDIGAVTSSAIDVVPERYDSPRNHSSESQTTSSALPHLPPSVKAQSPLERANQLIANGAYGEAVRLLQQLLGHEPRNTEALWLLARVYEQQGLHKESVATWFRYLGIEIDAKKMEDALAYLAKYLIRLSENPAIFGESYEWLMLQINDLIKLTPDNGELHLLLAKMHLKLEEKEQAQYHALMAANQPDTQARAEGLLAKLYEGTQQDDSPAEMQIPLIRFGSQFLVPVTIEGEQVKLLLDTGASISGLTASFINRHYPSVKSPKPIQLNTASGTVETYLFLVDTLTIDNVTFNKHMLARLPMDNADLFDGLLGVDILGRFDFVIDQQAAVLRLRKRQ